MRRIAVFVDAGYFWVQIVNVIHGKRDGRDKVSITYSALRQGLIEQVQTQFPDIDLLRIYWYDGPGPNGKSSSHKEVEALDDFKLRLGTRNGAGAQKAVDGLIIADMIVLAQTKAISDALLITGDADMTPGVMAAQNLGIRVHLLSMGPTDATSPFLKAEVDRKTHWDDVEVRKFATAVVPVVNVPAAAAPIPKAPAVVPAPVAAKVWNPHEISQSFFDGLDAGLRAQLPKKGALPSDIDKSLLIQGRSKLGRILEEDEKRSLRVALRAIAHPD